MSALSLRGRLTLLYGGLVLIAGVISLAAIYLVVERRLEAELTGDDLNARLELLREQMSATGESSVTLPDGTSVSLDQLLEETRADQEAIKNTALDTLILQGGVAVVVVGLIAGGIGWIVAGRGLQPLGAMTMTAQRIANSRGVERDLRERIVINGRADDVQRLAASFNAMLDRLDQAFDAQRRFVANASHELRTPLALERAVIELEASKPGTSADGRRVYESLLSINDRHTRLIEGLLMLIDSENEITNPEVVDLADVAVHVVALARAGATRAGIEIEDQLAPAEVLGDPVMLEQLARNLVENAIRHNRSGGWIRVETTIAGCRAELRVSNSGDLIPDYEVPHLFEPFRRLNTGSPGGDRGFGLGLSIVRAIVHAHGGQIEAVALPEGGLSVTVSLSTVQ